MKAVQLKSNIHEIVDRIQSEELLQTLYDFLTTRENSNPGEIWKTLTPEEKQELMASYAESENQDNLIEAGKVIKKMR